MSLVFDWFSRMSNRATIATLLALFIVFAGELVLVSYLQNNLNQIQAQAQENQFREILPSPTPAIAPVDQTFCLTSKDQKKFSCQNSLLQYCYQQNELPITTFCKYGCSNSGACKTPISVQTEIHGRFKCEPSRLIKFAGVLVDPNIIATLNNFITTASYMGHQVVVMDGYRSCDDQNKLYEECEKSKNQQQKAACIVAPAEYSQHQTGKAVDLYIMKNGQLESIIPLRSVAVRMGMVNPFFPDDPPHFYIP